MKLFCAIVGVAGSAFPVDIDADKTVAELKEAIKEQSDGLIRAEDPWTILQLFSAKKADGGWLPDDDDLDKMLQNNVDTSKMEKLRASWKLNKKGLFGSLEEDVVHVLVVVPRAASVSANEKKRKRMDIEEPPDAWMMAIKDEKVTALPSTCGDLKEHLRRALHVKVPIDDTLADMVSVGDLSGEYTSIYNKLFEPEPRGKISHRTASIVGSVIDPTMACSENATEETYHHLWDSLIATVLKRVSGGSFLRNTNSSTSTGLCRPDLCFYYENTNKCVFRGEEKARGELQVPLKELYEKLAWKYDAAPYIFGYAAVGLQVCLVAIRKDEKKKVEIIDGKRKVGAKVEIIESYDLGGLKGRLSFFLALLNLSTLFQRVADLITESLGVPEYSTIQRSNGVQITFAEDCVMKTYPPSMPSDDIIRNLRELHRQMKKHSVPNVVELKNTNMKKKHVKLAPVGRPSPPENAQQLLMALRDILEALVALHAINLMHRDLRWENVLKYSGDEDKWFLIDFDEGTSSPAAAVTHLKAESHAPEVSSSNHTIKVDIWGVGFLLMTSTVQDRPPELKQMQTQCLEVDPSRRPTAKALLKAINNLLAL